MAMTSAQRKALDRTLEVLAEDLDVTPAVIHLKSKEILQDIDEERISSKVTEKEKVMELVKIIKKRGKKAFRALTEYLENCLGSEHLVEELDENLKTVEAELAGLTVRTKCSVIMTSSYHTFLSLSMRLHFSYTCDPPFSSSSLVEVKGHLWATGIK